MINWKARLTNKTFWVALSSAIVLLCQQLGLNIFPDNIHEIINTLLLIFTILGVIIDPSTPTMMDNTKEVKKL